MKITVLTIILFTLACANSNLTKNQKEQNIIILGNKIANDLKSFKAQRKSLYLGSEIDVCSSLYAEAEILKKYAVSIESYVTRRDKEVIAIELERDLHSLMKNIDFESYPQGRGSAFVADVAELYAKHLTNRIIYFLCKLKINGDSFSDKEILSLLTKFGYRWSEV